VASLLQAIVVDVPLPQATPKGAAYHAVWAKLEVGHSVPMDTPSAKRLISNAQHWGKALGRKFVHRQLPAGGSAIWRTE
jgi:hypothetical protein